MIALLDRYGGWPIVNGDNWKAQNWSWIDKGQQILNDGLIKLMLDVGIGVDLKNSTRNVLIVSASISQKCSIYFKMNESIFKRLIALLLDCHVNF